MEKAAKILENTVVLLDKYKKNKTFVSSADLAGRYKEPFQKLKRQLADSLSEYLRTYSTEQLIIAKDDGGHFEEFVAAVNRIFSECDMGKRVGKAAFKEFDLEKVKQLAEELRSKVYEEAWVPYFHKHTGLYLTEECLAEHNPQPPRIYNSLVDMFWSEETKEWISS